MRHFSKNKKCSYKSSDISMKLSTKEIGITSLWYLKPLKAFLYLLIHF